MKYPIPGSTAILETREDFETFYRIRMGGRVTRWGNYQAVFYLDGVYFLSAYYTEHDDWRQMSALEVLGYLRIGQAVPDGWTAWQAGDDHDVPDDTRVQLLFHDEGVSAPGPAALLLNDRQTGETKWFSVAGMPPTFIVGYRVVPASVENPWIDWVGGKCPVSPDAKVEYRMQCGEVATRIATRVRWSRIGSPDDLVAYRVVPASVENPWVDWDGGDRPVSEGTKVHYRLRNGYCGVVQAGILEWVWATAGCPPDEEIVAYRVVPS